MGLEPATYGLQNRCSTIELHRHTSYDIKDIITCQVLIFYGFVLCVILFYYKSKFSTTFLFF